MRYFGSAVLWLACVGCDVLIVLGYMLFFAYEFLKSKVRCLCS
jgi:hypothetical protein